jgi:HD-like signal output (HDOD) protein
LRDTGGKEKGMQLSESVTEIRQRILLLKEIPPLPMTAQRILCMHPEADVRELAGIIEQSPELAARLLGMANSAYFAWPGGVRTIHDAIYKVLGLKLVKSLVLGMTLSEVFDVKKCRGFRLERYWFTAIVTAQMAQGLFPSLPPFLRGELDNIHMNGLLHNLGMAVLAHLYPRELSHAFSSPVDSTASSTTERIRNVLGILQTQAAGWIARKWHLPRDIVFVMEHHKDTGYRGDFWPVVILVGYCERQSQQLFEKGVFSFEPEITTLLGIDPDDLDRMRSTIYDRHEDLLSMASLMATGD